MGRWDDGGRGQLRGLGFLVGTRFVEGDDVNDRFGGGSTDGALIATGDEHLGAGQTGVQMATGEENDLARVGEADDALLLFVVFALESGGRVALRDVFFVRGLVHVRVVVVLTVALSS